MRSLCFLFFTTFILSAAPVDEAVKYHNLLLKNADNEVLMKRFLEAWLDEQDRESLENWLETEAKAGTKAGRSREGRVWARYLDHIGAAERAMAQYQEVLRLEPNDAQTALAVARLQAAGFDFKGALATLGEREDLEAMLLRGTYEYRLGNTEIALELWRILLEKSPEDRELREDLVRLLRQEGLGKEARELQEELIAVEDDPFQRALDQLELGVLQLEGGLKEHALASYRQVLESSGSDSWLEREALHQLQEVFRRERDADGLGAYLSALRAEMPHRMALQKAFARQLVAAGQIEEGAAVFREVLRRVPGEEQQRLEFVELLAFAEEYQEAAEELQVVLKSGAKKELWVRLAELQEKFAEEEVLATLGEVEALQGGDAVGVLEMARVYGRFERDEQALRVLQGGREDHADSREISEALAVLLVKLEREGEALAIWQGMAKNGGLEETVRVAQSMQRQQLEEDAFALLGERREELAKSFGGLRLYCELALQEEEYEVAWAGVLQLIRLPEVFTDLQATVTLGAVIGQKFGLEKSISELGEVKGENALCLLATLQEKAGDWQEADAILARTEGELGQRHRIVLLKQRGDFGGAIAHLREMMGDGGSLVLRKELLELLERQGDYPGALVEAEQWKMLSPGEVQAWKKRANILGLLGRYAEASDEMRRARNRFGKDDVELTRELAEMQLPLGRHREALRLYEHLFRAAGTDEERLKFVDEMYAAARQVGLDQELMVGFEQEHEAAKQEVFPLRLLARLYRLSNNSGAQQEALLKLRRLLPDDDKVLFELVDLAQKNNDLAGARQLLSEYATQTRSAGVLRRLATTQLQAGEVDLGLEMLGRIDPAQLDAGDVEATSLALWKLQEHQLALSLLEEQEAMVKADWRLQSMRADFLKKVGRVEEAQEVWITLLGAEGALGRPASANAYSVIQLPTAEPVREQRWRQLLAVVSYENSRGGNLFSASVYIPTSAREARWLSLALLAAESLRADASGESWQIFIETLDHDWLTEVREWGLFQKERTWPAVAQGEAEEPERTPEIRLQILVNNPEASPEEFLKLVPELEAVNPTLANSCRLHAAFRRPEGAEKLAELQAVVARIPKEEQGGWLNAGIFLRLVNPDLSVSHVPSLQDKFLEAEQREKVRLLAPWWKRRIEQSLVKNPLTDHSANELAFCLSLQRLSGDIQGFFKNLNRMMDLIAAAPPMQSPGQKSVVRYSSPLEGLPDRNRLFNYLRSRNFLYRLVGQAKPMRIPSPELLAKARKEGWGLEGFEQLEEYAKGIPSVKDGFLRALLFEKIGREEEAFDEMHALARTGSLEGKLDALAFRHGAAAQRGENETLLRALLALDKAEMSPAELNLLDAVTLGEARKCRDIKSLDNEEKSEVATILARFTKGPAGRSKVSGLRSLYISLRIEFPRQRETERGGLRNPSYRRLLTEQDGRHSGGEESEQQRLAAYFMEQVRRSLSSHGAAGRHRGLLQLLKDPKYRGFKEKIFAIYQPGESRSYQKRIRYAQLCLAYGELEKAEQVLKSLLTERPYDSELELLLLLALEPERRVAFLDEISQNQDIAEVIDFLTGWAELTEKEDPFFDAYERLVALMEERIDEFALGDSQKLFGAFKGFQNLSRTFPNRNLRRMSAVLPRVKEGEDSKEGGWALRTQQRKILLAAYGEMLRLRGIRGQVFQHIQGNREALRLSGDDVERIVFELLKKEPIKEVGFVESHKNSSLVRYNNGYRTALKNGIESLSLQAAQDSEGFTEELLERFVHHDFLSEKQGILLKAALDGDAEQVETLLGEYQQELEADFQARSARGAQQPHLFPHPMGSLDSQPQWEAFLEILLRSERWTEPIHGMLEEMLSDLLGEEEYRKGELLRVCELGSAEEALSALEAAAEVYFPVVAMHESYEELKAVGAIPSEVAEKIKVGTSLFTSLQNVPRAWIPLLTFLEESDRAVWLNLREDDIRSQLQRRLDVMYKRVFYDRIEAEGFGSYDGLALLGEESVTDSGALSTWLEDLMTPLKLAPTEGRTYWTMVSEDCREQVEDVTYLEAFLAMRKDFQISDEERQQVLASVLESELAELSGLNEKRLRGLVNLMERDFSKLEVPGASEELERFLAELRHLPQEGLAEKTAQLIGDEKALRVLGDNQAMGMCRRVAAEENVELAAEFWVAFLKAKATGERRMDFKNANFRLLARKPFEGTLDLVDSVRFVRLVCTALQEQPELAESMTYTRDMLEWREEFSPYSKNSRDSDPAGLIPHLDKVLQREGVAEFDKRVIGAFLIKGNYSGRAKDISQDVYRVQLEQSALFGHSPGIAETLLALSQLEGERVGEQDLKALKVISGYLRDQELAPDMRADLARSYLSKFERDETLLEFADAESIGVALRDLLMRGSYGATGKLLEGGEMLSFVNEHLAKVPLELQREIYEGWIVALKEDSNKVLNQKVGSSQKGRLSGLIYDFLDGGKRFPLPQQLRDELVRSFSGNLDMMQRLLRSGNEELFAELLPKASDRFRLSARGYSAATRELQESIWGEISEEHRVRLMCYLASLRDSRDWKASEESAGHLQADRALAAAKLFVGNPPEEQVVRLSAIDDLEYFVEALTVLMPLLTDQLQDDLPALAKRHRGEVRYLLLWMKAGGEETLKVFAPDSKKPLKMYSIREYEPALARLKDLLAPLLSEQDKMRLTCELAVLRDPRVEDENEAVLPTRTTRLEEAARYIQANPLPEENREEEKAFVAQLVKAGLDEALAKELMLRYAVELEEIDEASLLAMRPAVKDLFVFQLEASLAKGDAAAAMKCLQVLVQGERKLSERSSLLGFLLPKVALPLIACSAQENDEVGKESTEDLKDLSEKLFKMTFVEKGMRISEGAQRAVLFLAFATHCLGGDKAGFEALQNEASADGRRDLDKLTGLSRAGRGDFVSVPALPFYFDEKNYQSEEFKPLRQLLFAKIQEHSFTALLENPSLLELMSNLGLKTADVQLNEDEFALARGNVDLILSTILDDDQALFLSLLPTRQEAFYEGRSSGTIDASFGSGRREPLYLVRRHWINHPWAREEDLIEDDFRRLHFEVFMSSVLGSRYFDGGRFGLRNGDDEALEDVLGLLPDSGPAREQVVAILGGMVRPGSRFAEALVAQAVAEGSELNKDLGGLELTEQRVRLDSFTFGWICAMHADDWSVLDFQFQQDVEEGVADILAECACRQALYQVAGEPGTLKEVMARLAQYGVQGTDPTEQAWLELIGLVGGAKTSPWKERLQTLDEEQKRLAQAEMAAGLQGVLSSLEKVDFSDEVKSRWRPNGRSKLKNVWMHPLARERGERVLDVIARDELELFSTVEVSEEKRVSLVLGAFDWQQMKSCIEERFEGNVEKRALMELALNGQPSEVSRGDFLTFLESVASQSTLGSRERSELWLKVARGQILGGNLKRAKAASENIDPEHFEEYEVTRLKEQLRKLEAAAEE